MQERTWRRATPLLAACLAWLVGQALMGAGPAHATEFVIVGGRAAGMGGAGTAVTTDASAAYWNPAGLALSRGQDIRLLGSVHVTDRVGIIPSINTAAGLRDLGPESGEEEIANNMVLLDDLVNRFGQPGASVSTTAAGGLYYTYAYGRHSFGVSLSDIATGGAFFPVVEKQFFSEDGSFTNNTTLTMRVLEARQLAFSYASSFWDEQLSFGVNVKIIQGAAYSSTKKLFGSNGEFTLTKQLGLVTNVGKPEISTDVGIDAGVMWRPTSWLGFGLVGRDLNEPSFDSPEGADFKLGPQLRGGMYVAPTESTVITFDADLRRNPTLVPHIKHQLLSLGAEHRFCGGCFSLRGGVLKNVADAHSTFLPTAGFGVDYSGYQVDFGMGYDFRGRQVMAGITLAKSW